MYTILSTINIPQLVYSLLACIVFLLSSPALDEMTLFISPMDQACIKLPDLGLPLNHTQANVTVLLQRTSHSARTRHDQNDEPNHLQAEFGPETLGWLITQQWRQAARDENIDVIDPVLDWVSQIM